MFAGVRMKKNPLALPWLVLLLVSTACSRNDVAPGNASTAPSPGVLLPAAAPVPNPDLVAPIPPDRVSVVPTLLHGPRDLTNDGFLAGSKFQNRGEDIPSTRGPGFQLQMPIP